MSKRKDKDGLAKVTNEKPVDYGWQYEHLGRSFVRCRGCSTYLCLQVRDNLAEYVHPRIFLEAGIG